MKHLCKSALLLTVVSIGMAGMEAQAKTRTISDCAQKLIARGFNVIDKEIDDNLYEFEAIKSNQKWDIKMDQKCNVLLERIDD
jgi:hypothetical protein